MANRRMFSKRIIGSARFLKMPLSTQALYFHLCLEADDDGIVEAFPIMRLLGVSEDDLKVLSAKKLITVLNEDLVSHVSDWLEHNVLRADRKIDSIYKSLLLKILPDVELIEPKPRGDVKNDGRFEIRTVRGQSTGGIGKDRLGKDSIVKEESVSYETPPSPTYKTKKKILENRGLKLKPKKLSEKQVRLFEADKIIQEFRNVADEKGFDLLSGENKGRNSRISAQIVSMLIQNRDLTGFINWWFDGKGEWCGYAPENLFTDRTFEDFKNKQIIKQKIKKEATSQYLTIDQIIAKKMIK